MLTRLKVNGFKNLVDVDVRFGPFTCIAGLNGVGKSNLFDAIRFLSALSREPLLAAAQEVRGGKTADVRDLFHRVGDDYDNEMLFVAEMIVPKTGEDDLGQPAEASATFLRYSLRLAYRPENGGLEIRSEELTYIRKGDAEKFLAFKPSREWIKSILEGGRTVPFISTEEKQPGEATISLHQDRGGGSGGKASPRRASSLPRTVIQAANAAENRTAVLARREMESWRLLRLEPLSLREPDAFTAPTHLSEQGANLPATLARLAQRNEAQTYAAAANRLSELISDVREVGIDRDEKRELLTLWARGEDGTRHAARSLSEGTLRFMALTVLELDPESSGVICLEEPENGIHPERIPAMLRLLKDIAVDPRLPVDADNPLRQVIVNTHSPAIVLQAEKDDLVWAALQNRMHGEQTYKRVAFRPVRHTWRAEGLPDSDLMSLGEIIAYLNPEGPPPPPEPAPLQSSRLSPKRAKLALSPRRMIDQPDIAQLRLFRYDK